MNEGNSARCKRWREKKKMEDPGYFSLSRKKRKVDKGGVSETKLQSPTSLHFETPNQFREERELDIGSNSDSEEYTIPEIKDYEKQNVFVLENSFVTLKAPFTMVVGGPSGSGDCFVSF